jgi:hypothetical protein
MNVEIFTLCDLYQEMDGKQNITGIFDVLYVDINKPIITARFFIVSFIRILETDKDEHSFNFRINDPDGNAINNPIDIIIDVTDYAKRTTLIKLAKSFSSLKLPSPGRYSVTLNISGKDAATIPLFIKHKAKKK